MAFSEQWEEELHVLEMEQRSFLLLFYDIERDGSDSGTDAAARRVSVGPHPHYFSRSIYHGFGVLSAVVGLLQLVNQGIGVGPSQSQILSASFCLIALSASMTLPSSCSSICLRVCFFFAVLAAASFLSPVLPDKLRWVPYISCTYPALRLLSADSRHFLQQQWRRGWDAAAAAASGPAYRAYQGLRSSLQAVHNAVVGAAASSSSPRSIEEGNGRIHGNSNDRV